MSTSIKAERGSVYTWINIRGDFHSNICLVVSNNNRSRDKLISILFLSTDRGQTGADCVEVELDGEKYIVHTDLVTYTQRYYLQQKIGEISPETMDVIDDYIADSLGLNDGINYKTMYECLVDDIVGRR